MEITDVVKANVKSSVLLIREDPGLISHCNLKLDEDLSDFRLTVDTEEDYLRAKMLFERFGENVQFSDIVIWEKQNSL